MAQNQTTAEAFTEPTQGAVLHPGRAADPVRRTPQDAMEEHTEGASTESEDQLAGVGASENSGQPEAESDEGNDEQQSEEEVAPLRAQSHQRHLRLMLRQCDRVLLMDFDLLAMNGWPDNFSLAAARRNRDLWIFCVLVAATIFLSGLTGVMPAWIAGGGFGAFVIILLLGVPAVRRIYSSKASYLDLLFKRQRMMRDARKHAEHLEGEDGLIWQCARMADFNPALKNTRFSSLVRLSEQKLLPRALTKREHVRLYLIYLLEAEKAYSSVQTTFFEGNQEAIDLGWQIAVAEPEGRT